MWWFALWVVGFGRRTLTKEKLSSLSILHRLIFFVHPIEGRAIMSKRELIDYICEINRSAKPEFLANFSEDDLHAYLEHLMELDLDSSTVYS
jgi:hypothetical protein